MKKPKMSKARRRRIASWSLIAVLVLSVGLPLASYGLHWLGSAAIAQDASSATNPRSNMWGAVRDGVEGYSSVTGPGANVLVQASGNDWRLARNGAISEKLPWVIVGMFALVVLYHLIHGKNRLDADRLSGRKIPRWNFLDRLVHWTTAISFILLAITGLSMLIGKQLLIPVLGKAGFAMWAQLAISIHNVVGPVFCAGVALMIIMWIWYNLPTRVDMKWFAQLGGLIGKKHPSAGRMNGGEKVWFWLLATGGTVVCITGLIMVAPVYGWQIPGLDAARSTIQQANLLHAVIGVVWTAVAIGHIYIGTAGTEGAFEGMATGYVSEEWAKQHHDLWYDKMVAKGKVVEPGDAQAADAKFARPDAAGSAGASG